jgi:hypothetical protein
MISYRPTLELTTGRKGFRAAIVAMVLAAVVGTTAFGSVGSDTVTAAAAAPAIVAGSTVPAEQTILRRQDAGGSLDQGAAVGPLAA